jgi:hypothetical protein
MPKAAYKSKPVTSGCKTGLAIGPMIDLFRCLASVREDLRTGRKDAAASQRNLVEQLQAFIARNAVLPRYAERDPRDGSLWFCAYGCARIPLPSDPTTPEFRAAYNAALFDTALPVYVERDRNGNLFFRLSPGSRKRPLPNDRSSAEFNRAYHAALLDAGENNDLDDWSELRAFHAAQRVAMHKASRRGTAKRGGQR